MVECEHCWIKMPVVDTWGGLSPGLFSAAFVLLAFLLLQRLEIWMFSCPNYASQGGHVMQFGQCSKAQVCWGGLPFMNKKTYLSWKKYFAVVPSSCLEPECDIWRESSHFEIMSWHEDKSHHTKDGKGEIKGVWVPGGVIEPLFTVPCLPQGFFIWEKSKPYLVKPA